MRWKKGYTLIEILVGISIIGILFAAGYVSFRDFSRRQALLGSAKLLQADFRLAQQMALAGTKPDELGCQSNSLDGIRFNITDASPDPSYYVIRAVCGAVSDSSNPIIKTVYLPSGIVPNLSQFSPNPLLFKVLGQGTNIPEGTDSVIVLTQEGINVQPTITISSSGDIK